MWLISLMNLILAYLGCGDIRTITQLCTVVLEWTVKRQMFVVCPYVFQGVHNIPVINVADMGSGRWWMEMHCKLESKWSIDYMVIYDIVTDATLSVSVGMLNSIYFHNRCSFCNNPLIIDDRCHLTATPVVRNCRLAVRRLCRNRLRPVATQSACRNCPSVWLATAGDSGKDAA